MGRQKLHYICTEQTLRAKNGNLRRAYRFLVLDISGTRPVVLRVVDDVCSSETQARALERLFRRNNVPLSHVMDVLEDWLV
jgi:hypothetical protein